MKSELNSTTLTDSELLAIKLAWQEMERDRILGLLETAQKQYESLIRLRAYRSDTDHSHSIARTYQAAAQMIRANS